MRNIQIDFPDEDDFIERLKVIVQDLLQQQNQQPKTESKNEQSYLTRAEICLLYRISLPTLHKFTASCGLPSIKVGRRRVYDPVEVAKYFASKNQK